MGDSDVIIVSGEILESKVDGEEGLGLEESEQEGMRADHCHWKAPRRGTVTSVPRR